MRKRKVITIAVIVSLVGVFIGMYYLMDAYVKYQSEKQLISRTGSQAAGVQQYSDQGKNLIWIIYLMEAMLHGMAAYVIG